MKKQILVKEFTDVQTDKTLNLPRSKINRDNVIISPSKAQLEMIDGSCKRFEKIRNSLVFSSLNNLLILTNHGRKLALDKRAINSKLPENTEGKTSICSENVYQERKKVDSKI